jgi:hypothetical protein
MEENFLKREENIAKILGRIVSLCKQTDLTDLAKKGEKVLKNYDKAKTLRK